MQADLLLTRKHKQHWKVLESKNLLFEEVTVISRRTLRKKQEPIV